jgi:hypothetical protein
MSFKQGFMGFSFFVVVAERVTVELLPRHAPAIFVSFTACAPQSDFNCIESTAEANLLSKSQR